MRNVVRCSDYVGPHEENHVKIFIGQNYSDSLSKAGLARR
jgi:hypothetical protein